MKMTVEFCWRPSFSIQNLFAKNKFDVYKHTVHIMQKKNIYVHIAQNTVHLLPKPSYPWHVIYACELSESASLASALSLFQFGVFVCGFCVVCTPLPVNVAFGAQNKFWQKTFPSELYFGGELIALFHPIYFFHSHIDTRTYSLPRLPVCLSVCLFHSFNAFHCIQAPNSKYRLQPASTLFTHKLSCAPFSQKTFKMLNAIS